MRSAALTLFAFAGAAFAHPDHRDGVIGLLHLLTEPDHLALLLAPIAAAAALWVYRARRRRR